MLTTREHLQLLLEGASLPAEHFLFDRTAEVLAEVNAAAGPNRQLLLSTEPSALLNFQLLAIFRKIRSSVGHAPNLSATIRG